MKALLLAGAIAAITTLSLFGVAHAQSDDDVKTPVAGSYLFIKCSQKPPPMYLTGANARDAANAVSADSYCAAFILGVVQSDPAIKLPNGVTFNDVKEIIHSYLAQHPELRYQPAAKLIEDVLVSAYPH
jgi:Rap1a immunity proteins